MLYSGAYISRETAISSFATLSKDSNSASQFPLVSVLMLFYADPGNPVLVGNILSYIYLGTGRF